MRKDKGGGKLEIVFRCGIKKYHHDKAKHISENITMTRL